MNKEPDTEYTDNMICPHCGFEDRDSGEVDFDGHEDTETQCGSCGEEFGVSGHISITYSTWRLMLP